MTLSKGAVLASAVLVACGGKVTSSSGTNGGTTDAGNSPACVAAAEAIAAKLSGQSCTIVVMLSASDVHISHYAIFCGPYEKLDEAAAKKQTMTDTGWFGPCAHAASIAGPIPADEFVFWEAPTDPGVCACCGSPGWIAAASARNGLTVFGTLMGMDGPIKYPRTWQPASDLGSDCTAPVKMPAARGFDFESVTQSKLDDTSIQSALGVVWNTALPLAVSSKQSIFDAMVLRYADTYLSMQPSEYVVFVNSGTQ